MRKAKYAYLLSDKDEKRWYEDRKSGPPATADIPLRRLDFSIILC